MNELEKRLFIIEGKIELLARNLGYGFNVDFEHIDGVEPEVEIYTAVKE